MSGSTGIRRTVCVLVLEALSAPSVIAGFVDVSTERGIGPYQNEEGHGSGATAVDYDGDGDIDIFVPQAALFGNLLYRNLGNGYFEEIAAAVGLDSIASSRVALWMDYDGDGDQDLLIANDDQQAASMFTLYRQRADGTFEDATAQAGLMIPPVVVYPDTHHCGGLCAGDINNDGFLDIFTAQWFGPGHLLLNNQAGGFDDISDSSGISVSNYGHQCLMADFNDDGWLDIFLAVDFDANLLWINQQDNTFVDQAPAAGVDNAMNDMGAVLGDYDNDGDFDLYITNIYTPPNDPMGYKHNILYQNNSVGAALSFADVSVAMAVEQGYFGWGTTFLDVDNDRDLDLAATNGWRTGEGVSDPSRLFVNPGDAVSAFAESSALWGFNDTDWGSALLAADFDRDGDLDMLQVCMDGPLRLWDNAGAAGGAGNNYLAVRLEMPGGNRRAVGSIVRVQTGGTTQSRLISAGTSYMGQEPAEAFFGLGDAPLANLVTVEWPDGTTTTLDHIPANRVITINQLTGVPDPIPAVSTWGLMVAGLALLVVGTTVFRRRQAGFVVVSNTSPRMRLRDSHHVSNKGERI
ncbi:MAG: FG-GAP-like repeat-containing protein [Phycisphaerae bacterium]